MDWRKYIDVDPDICHGQAHFRGTRVLVSVALDNLAAGETAERVASTYAIEPEAVRAALQYAAQTVRERVIRLPGDAA